MAAFELARANGLANVRVPEIAAAAGVSTRTFNNYFSSKEAAIAWPVVSRAAKLAENLRSRPADEPLREALLTATVQRYQPQVQDSLRSEWLRGLRRLIATEPGLRAEYLKAADSGDQGLAEAIATRTGAEQDDLRPKVLAAIVVSAERAAVMHWIKHAPDKDNERPPLRETVRAAVELALSEVE